MEWVVPIAVAIIVIVIIIGAATGQGDDTDSENGYRYERAKRQFAEEWDEKGKEYVENHPEWSTVREDYIGKPNTPAVLRQKADFAAQYITGPASGVVIDVGRRAGVKFGEGNSEVIAAVCFCYLELVKHVVSPPKEFYNTLVTAVADRFSEYVCNGAFDMSSEKFVESYHAWAKTRNSYIGNHYSHDKDMATIQHCALGLVTATLLYTPKTRQAQLVNNGLVESVTDELKNKWANYTHVGIRDVLHPTS